MTDSTRFAERYAALRTTFLNGIEARLAAIEAAWAVGHMETLFRESHRLAGACGSYELTALQAAADRLYRLAESGSLREAELRDCLAELRAAEAAERR